jgi:predicted metalloprotease
VSRSSAHAAALAEGYVLADEYGHHVQNLTGVLQDADRDTGPQGGQVRVELQAATRASGPGVRSTRAYRGEHPPRTHGSSEQRQSSSVRGIEGSGPQSCDTFRGRVRG